MPIGVGKAGTGQILWGLAGPKIPLAAPISDLSPWLDLLHVLVIVLVLVFIYAEEPSGIPGSQTTFLWGS